MTKTEIEEAARALPVEERYELANTLLETISPEDAARLLPLHDWQKEALDEALVDLQEHPETSVPWAEVKARLWPGA